MKVNGVYVKDYMKLDVMPVSYTHLSICKIENKTFTETNNQIRSKEK